MPRGAAAVIGRIYDIAIGFQKTDDELFNDHSSSHSFVSGMPEFLLAGKKNVRKKHTARIPSIIREVLGKEAA